MTTHTDNTAPPSTGMQGLISPWAFRHLRLCAGIRFGVTVFLVALGAVFFAVGHAGYAALPLAGAAVNLAWGYWQLTIARSATSRH